MSDKMTKMEKLAPVAQIACLSPVESEFEQLLNLSKRQASSHDASTFDGEKEAIETHEAEHEESFIWGHVVPVAAHAPLRQHIFSASKTVRIHSSDAVGRRPKSEIHEPLSNEANLQQPRHRGISAILVATHDQSQLKVNNIGESAVNALVSPSITPVGKPLDIQTAAGTDKTALPIMTTPSQPIATALKSTQSSPIDSSPISQPAAGMGRESVVTPQVSTMSVGKSLNSAQSVVNSEQVGRSLTTPPQPTATVPKSTQSLPIKSPLISQPAAVMGRESVVNPQVPTMPVGKSLNSAQLVVNSEQAGRSLTTPPQPIAVVPQSTQSSAIKSPLVSQPPIVMGRESGANLQKQSELKVAHSPVSILARVQRESNANTGLSAEEKKEDPIIKASVAFHSNLEVKEGGQQVNMVSIEEKSSVLATRMELPSLGSKLTVIGTVNTAMTVQPVLSSLMLHYQIAPEYFTQYVQLNTYRVFFRNKYYVFQFEDNKVTNFLEDYYDRY